MCQLQNRDVRFTLKMSAIEYNNLLFETSERLDQLNVLKRLLFMCRGKLASGSEDKIQDALSLFKELEKQNNLGIDRLEEMKELLKGVREWSLFEKVRKFEQKRQEYNILLEHIIPALDELDDLERLIGMCRGKISEESEGHIQDVRSLLKQLENRNNLGTHRLVILKEILTELEKNDLVSEVEEFEKRRNQEDESERKKEQRGAFVSSVGNTFTGAVKLVCNFCTPARGLLMVSSAMALSGCSTVKEYMEVFKEVILVSYTKLVGIREGSLCFMVQAETPSALRELWNIYKSGSLQTRLQEFLVTEEIQQLASGEDVEVTVCIDEKEYKKAYFDLMLLENQASKKPKEDGGPGGRPRRNSDSFLCIKPNEGDSTLMRLKYAENKWKFERQILEEENEKLKIKIAKAGNLKRRVFWHEEGSARETEDIERPRKRRRRNSDSSLYCKAKDDEVGESRNEPEIYLEEKTKYLDSEREPLVHWYLHSMIHDHETHGIRTETSDSGIRTHGAPSEFDEMENVTDYPQTYYLKDLSSEVIGKLQRALEVDDVARRHVNQSFGIGGHFYRFSNIFTLFPDTPVKLLKDVLEALQLYDLLDVLLEKPQPGNRSLKLALPLQEIEKLRKTDDSRPTTYHSSAAVLIIADEKDSDIEELKNFFNGLNSKSDVTVFRIKPEMERMGRLQKKIQKEKEELLTEIVNIKSSASAVIDRWIQNQGNFSLFAVFLFFKFSQLDFRWSMCRTLVENVTENLVFGIPHKIKFVICPPLTSGQLKPAAPETLQITLHSQDEAVLLKVLNKRWQTLDLVSMMKEVERSCNSYRAAKALVKDSLSTLPRFKKEDATN